MAHRDHHHHHHNHAELTKEDDKKVTEKKAETKAANVEEVSGKELKKAVKEPEIVEEPVVVVKEPVVVVKEPKVELETTAHHASHHHSHSEKEESAVKSTKKEVKTVLDAAVKEKAETVELPVVEESTHSSPSTHHSAHHHLTTELEEEEAVAEEAVAEPIHHHHHIASLGEAEESSLGSFVGLSKPGDADYADTFEAAATALREGTAPKTRYDSKMQNIASAIVALEDELRVSSYQPLLRAFSNGSGAGNGLGVSRLGRARSRTPLLDEWVEMARRRPDRDAALSTLRAAFGTGPKARRAMRIMVNDIRKAR